eukprot:CAMPEP_0202057762 /NCGR_PEP_ID=MMETSP0963-20130614/29555_1 /ASSEMBLY_ACC=CAM_ASM_000494 /TAXON_ID=4773 /ORGANISM="Schizochytrium aggregatum, Strain ATCC28209" /LENGTH=218 /DNA_ID=CAMNT_0048623663 /DNA_START=208 /DNA_END=865 /DNA_ORIENTATION=+
MLPRAGPGHGGTTLEQFAAEAYLNVHRLHKLHGSAHFPVGELVSSRVHRVNRGRCIFPAHEELHAWNDEVCEPVVHPAIVENHRDTLPELGRLLANILVLQDIDGGPIDVVPVGPKADAERDLLPHEEVRHEWVKSDLVDDGAVRDEETSGNKARVVRSATIYTSLEGAGGLGQADSMVGAPRILKCAAAQRARDALVNRCWRFPLPLVRRVAAWRVV